MFQEIIRQVRGAVCPGKIEGIESSPLSHRFQRSVRGAGSDAVMGVDSWLCTRGMSENGGGRGWRLAGL